LKELPVRKITDIITDKLSKTELGFLEILIATGKNKGRKYQLNKAILKTFD
jgi:DNA repair protein RadC